MRTRGEGGQKSEIFVDIINGILPVEISDGLKRRAISAAATDGGCGGSTEEEEEGEENISVTDIAFRGCRADRRVFSRGIHI